MSFNGTSEEQSPSPCFAQLHYQLQSPNPQSPNSLSFNPYEDLEAYRLKTEYNKSFGNPNEKRIKGFEDYEQNRMGRKAYIPDKEAKATEGIIPLYSGTSYPIILPKYKLPKLYQ